MKWDLVFETTNENTKEGSEISVKAKILEGVEAATKLGDTLVELQIFSWLTSFV